MKPLQFESANCCFGANQPEYQPLPAERIESRNGQIISCWGLSPEELKKVQETGKIWLSVLTFNQPLQPMLLSVDKPEIEK